MRENDTSLSLGCVILAAGNSSRFGSNKLIAELHGRSLIHRAFETVPPGLFSRVVVVTQYPEIMVLAGEFQFASILNDKPEDGLSRSVAMGLTALRDCAGVLFLVCDQPLLRRKSVEKLVHLWHHHPDCIAALGHGGVRGNPCLFPARFYPELMALSGDQGGSTVIRAHEESLILLETAPEELADTDTPEALEFLR